MLRVQDLYGDIEEPVATREVTVAGEVTRDDRSVAHALVFLIGVLVVVRVLLELLERVL